MMPKKQLFLMGCSKSWVFGIVNFDWYIEYCKPKYTFDKHTRWNMNIFQLSPLKPVSASLLTDFSLSRKTADVFSFG